MQQATSDLLPLRMDQLAEAQLKDNKLQQIIFNLRTSATNHSKQKYILIHHVLHQVSKEFPPRICIPESLQQHYLQFYHGHPLSGHLCFHKILQKIRATYYWLRMRQDASNFIKECKICQQVKNPN
jgi:hypothetical protein